MACLKKTVVESQYNIIWFHFNYLSLFCWWFCAWQRTPETSKSTSVFRNIGYIHPHQVHYTEAAQDRLFHLPCPNPIPAQKNPNSVQISMKLWISTFTVLLLSKELGQTFVSPVNTIQATRLPPCDLLHMKSWQCSFENSSFWSSPTHHWGRAEFHHYFLQPGVLFNTAKYI